MSDLVPSLCRLARWSVPSVILLSGFVACGGNVSEDGDSKDSSGGAAGSGAAPSGGASHSDGGTNAGSGGSGAASSGGGTNTSSGGNLGTGGETDSPCDQPIESGDCDAAFPRFAYDSLTGLCVPFSYGGCGGNNNNFEGLKSCDDACRDGKPSPPDGCSSNSECNLAFLGCCGICEPMSLDSYRAVNRAFQNDLENQAGEQCSGLNCGACAEGESVSQNYGTVCENNQCVAFDVRKVSVLSDCNEDSDCMLRVGVACCEPCGEARADSVVAVSSSAAVREYFCGVDNDAACPPCVGEAPNTTEARCVDNTCQVVRN